MKIIASRKLANGNYAEVGTTNQILLSHYKTVNGAVKHGALPWANGCAIRIEVFPDGNVYRDPSKVLYFDEVGIQVQK